jgi:hypothetical protein
VPVLISCTELFGITVEGLAIVPMPFWLIVTPDVDRLIAVVPMFTIVINVPIGNATDALVGIVMVCAPVLAE